jgi:hypothetical protein
MLIEEQLMSGKESCYLTQRSAIERGNVKLWQGQKISEANPMAGI